MTEQEGNGSHVAVRGQSKKKELRSTSAALPIGPYSQGIQAGNFVFVAGEKGIDPKTGKLVPGASRPKHARRSPTSKLRVR